MASIPPAGVRDHRRVLSEELALADDELLGKAASLLPDVEHEKYLDERERGEH